MKTKNRSHYSWNKFPSKEDLSNQLANQITIIINEAIVKNGQAIVAFSGGSTPLPLFHALQQQSIEWSKVIVTLVDERWVDEYDSLSNGAFIKKHLLSHLPEKPLFLDLYRGAASVDASLKIVWTEYCKTLAVDDTVRFDVVILGMGGDGHTASFFPDAPNISNLVDLNSNEKLLSCSSPSTQVPRITWSLPVLLNTNNLILHITGKDKQAVFDKALQTTDTMELPIRSFIFQDQVLLKVFYAN